MSKVDLRLQCGMPCSKLEVSTVQPGRFPAPAICTRARARAQGTRLGRRPIDARKEAAIRADLREGKAGIMKLAAAHGVGVGTVQRISRALALAV